MHLKSNLHYSADFALLKKSDVSDGFITFKREKTKRTSKSAEQIKIVLIPELQQIIDRWGAKEGHISFSNPNYLQSGKRSEKDCAAGYDRINHYMKLISKELKLPLTPTSYHARNLYATIIQTSGVPISMISKNLGHANIAITQAYLGDFGDQQLKDAAKNLGGFYCAVITIKVIHSFCLSLYKQNLYYGTKFMRETFPSICYTSRPCD